jgi:hypothetical protein
VRAFLPASSGADTLSASFISEFLLNFQFSALNFTLKPRSMIEATKDHLLARCHKMILNSALQPEGLLGIRDWVRATDRLLRFIARSVGANL